MNDYVFFFLQNNLVYFPNELFPVLKVEVTGCQCMLEKPGTHILKITFSNKKRKILLLKSPIHFVSLSTSQHCVTSKFVDEMEDFSTYTESMAMLILSFVAIGALFASVACIVFILFNCCYNLMISRYFETGWMSNEVHSKHSSNDSLNITANFKSTKESVCVFPKQYSSHTDPSHV